MVIGRRSPSLAPQNGISEGDSAALVASRAASSERRIPRAEGRHSVALKLTPNASPCVLLRPRGLSSSAGSRLVRRMGLESYDSGGRGRGLRSRGSQAAGRPLHICTDRTGPRERLHPTACRASPLPPCPPPGPFPTDTARPCGRRGLFFCRTPGTGPTYPSPLLGVSQNPLYRRRFPIGRPTMLPEGGPRAPSLFHVRKGVPEPAPEL